MANEELLTLPGGHPEAGAVSPDRSFRDGAGTLPPDEQEAYDEMVADREDEVERVSKHEDEVARKEREAELGTTTKTTASKTSSGSGTSSSSS